jgi:hypothetical protein
MTGRAVDFPSNQWIHATHAGMNIRSAHIVEQSAGAQREFHITFSNATGSKCSCLGVTELQKQNCHNRMNSSNFILQLNRVKFTDAAISICRPKSTSSVYTPILVVSTSGGNIS